MLHRASTVVAARQQGPSEGHSGQGVLDNSMLYSADNSNNNSIIIIIIIIIIVIVIVIVVIIFVIKLYYALSNTLRGSAAPGSWRGKTVW